MMAIEWRVNGGGLGRTGTRGDQLGTWLSNGHVRGETYGTENSRDDPDRFGARFGSRAGAGGSRLRAGQQRRRTGELRSAGGQVPPAGPDDDDARLQVGPNASARPHAGCSYGAGWSSRTSR